METSQGAVVSDETRIGVKAAALNCRVARQLGKRGECGRDEIPVIEHLLGTTIQDVSSLPPTPNDLEFWCLV